MGEKSKIEKPEIKEEEMKKSKEISVAEKEELPTVFMIYRDNDLFKKWVPKIAEMLKKLGRKVEIQSFPVGTPKEEIENWYLAHQAELQSKNILADYTSIRSCGYDKKTFYDKKFLRDNLRPKINLDTLMNWATIEAITGDASLAKQLGAKVYENRDNPEKQREAKQEYLSALGEIYKKILSSIPEEQRQKMEVVILKGLFKGNYVFPSLIAHESYVPDGKNFEELQKETDDFAGRMKEWFGEAGIFNITVFSTGAEIPTETIRKLTKGSAYIILDRHTSTSDQNLTQEGEEDMRDFWGPNVTYSGLVKETAALQTPIETFYNDIQKKIGIAADPQKIEELVKNELEKNLAEKE